MRVTAITTRTVHATDRDLIGFIDEHIDDIQPRTVVAVTSKVVAICQGRVVPLDAADKDALIRDEAERYLDPSANAHGVALSIKYSRLIPMAGIDESNADGHYILWPSDPQGVANRVRAHLAKRAGGPVGVVLTDSTTMPLRLGASGVSLAASGFAAVRSYVGETDLFGRALRVTNVNLADALAAAAVLVMGEGAESTPIAMIEDVPFIDFVDRDPSDDDLALQVITPEDDLYWPLLNGAPWRRGGGGAASSG